MKHWLGMTAFYLTLAWVALHLGGCRAEEPIQFGRLTYEEPAYLYCYESNKGERCFIGRRDKAR